APGVARARLTPRRRPSMSLARRVHRAPASHRGSLPGGRGEHRLHGRRGRESRLPRRRPPERFPAPPLHTDRAPAPALRPDPRHRPVDARHARAGERARAPRVRGRHPAPARRAPRARPARASSSPADVSEFYFLVRWLVATRGRPWGDSAPAAAFTARPGQRFSDLDRYVSALRKNYYAHPADGRWQVMVDALRGLG